MRVRLAALGLLVLAATGCEAVQLRNHVVKQAATLTDIQYQQVLDNLAMFVQDPAALPYFSLTPTGSVGIQQTGTASAGVNWDYLGAGSAFINHADKKNLGLMGNEQAIGQWSTSSLLNPDELTLMRWAFQRALGCSGQDGQKELEGFFKYNPARLEALQSGWYGAGGCKDVPRGACYVGHYHGTYVWVTPEGMEGLTRFTLAILDIATTLVPRPDPHIAQLAELEQRLKTVHDLYGYLEDKKSAEAIRLNKAYAQLLDQYTTLLEEHLKEKPAESGLFNKIRKDFQNLTPPPIVPQPGG
ncbi:MAG TPA: hypothetical protein VMS17_16965 [Gemmataceae bacterium]|nr:hypothetical protein [Gemmataceae bacterium]